MSASSNDHVHRDGDRPDEMGDIFSILSSRQLSVLYGILTNNPRRMVFMDQLQDIVVANAESIVRWATGGPPQKAMPKNNAKEPTSLRPFRLLSGPTDLQEAALCGDQMWLLL